MSSVENPSINFDPELHALTAISSLLADLSDDSQARIVNWISSRYRIPVAVPEPQSSRVSEFDSEFPDMASLFVAANPSTGSEKALIVAFWLQEHEHQDGWEGFAVNTELKHLGHGLKNITDALHALIEHKPQLA